jgi:hypothetical protein
MTFLLSLSQKIRNILFEEYREEELKALRTKKLQKRFQSFTDEFKAFKAIQKLSR